MADTDESPNRVDQGRTEPEAVAMPASAARHSERRSARRAPAILATLIVLGIVGLSLWYLAEPQPVLIQGEADATRIDIAARVEGRVGERPVERGDNVAAGQLLYRIDNPELIAKLKEAQAALAVAEANLANILAGTRVEEVDRRKAAVETAMAQQTLAQKTYGRVKELADSGNAPLQRLDEATNSLQVAERTADQAKFAYQEAQAGYTPDERAIAKANVADARATIDTTQAQVDELMVKAPIAGQVYQIGAELGEYVSPGVPLLSLVDLGDVWMRFDLREDLVKRSSSATSSRCACRRLATGSSRRKSSSIAPRGEYAGWRATRATGDFDLRTFEVRAYPTPPLPELRPGMSVYAVAPAGGR